MTQIIPLQINAGSTEQQYTIFKKKVNPLSLKKPFFDDQQAEWQTPNVRKAGRAKLLEFKQQKNHEW